MNLGNTNLNLYRSFIVAYETKNLTRAAEIMRVTREAVRHNIAELGRQLGVNLFTSHNKGIEPTKEAFDLYPDVKEGLEKIVQAENRIAALDYQASGHIKMFVHALFAKQYLNSFVRDFRAKYPEITLEFVQGNEIELLKQNKIDFAIDWDAMFEGTALKIRKILDKDFSVQFVATKAFLAQNNLSQTLCKKDIARLTIIEREEFLPALVNYFGTSVKQNFIKVSSIETVFSMVRDSVGIGSTGHWFVEEMNDPNIVKLKITDIKFPSVRMVCAYKALSRPARAFIDGFTAFVNNFQYPKSIHF